MCFWMQALAFTHWCNCSLLFLCTNTNTSLPHSEDLLTHETWKSANQLCRSQQSPGCHPSTASALIRPGGGLEGDGEVRRCRGRSRKLPCYCGTSYCPLNTAPGWWRPTLRPDWHAGSRLLARRGLGWCAWTGCPWSPPGCSLRSSQTDGRSGKKREAIHY